MAEPALNSSHCIEMSWVLTARGGTERFLFIEVCHLVNVKLPASICRRCDRGWQGSVISEVLFQLKDALESCTSAKASSQANTWHWGWQKRLILVTSPLTSADLAPDTFRCSALCFWLHLSRNRLCQNNSKSRYATMWKETAFFPRGFCSTLPPGCSD